jgi:hypothetical protein
MCLGMFGQGLALKNSMNHSSPQQLNLNIGSNHHRSIPIGLIITLDTIPVDFCRWRSKFSVASSPMLAQFDPATIELAD